MFWLKLGHERFPLREGESTVGRSHYCSVVVACASTSREHAALRVDGDQVQILDLGSRNGTWVNGKRVSERAALRVGDEITIGTNRFTLLESEHSGDTAATLEQPAVGASEFGAAETLPDSK
jgi:pSer/pThr/pTyr-binding forkhead associated (FHA) protein